jgi:hypothetical protein
MCQICAIWKIRTLTMDKEDKMIADIIPIH